MSRECGTDEQKLLRVCLGKRASYNHFFGHDATLKGLLPPGKNLPAHVLLTLDTRDPLLARLRLGSIPHFRLVHPFHYSQGEEFAYQQSEGSIKFLQHCRRGKVIDWPKGSIDWPAYKGQYPTHFTTIPATLEVEEPPYAGDDGLQDTIFLGANQEELRSQDGNPDCPQCKEVTQLIARIPDRIEGVAKTLWGDNYVDTLFFYCGGCQVVITHNECD
jgi:hypothetical protein